MQWNNITLWPSNEPGFGELASSCIGTHTHTMSQAASVKTMGLGVFFYINSFY